MINLAPPPPANWVKPVRVLDIECYPNYFLVKLRDVKTGQMFKVEMYDGCPFRWHVLALLLRDCTVVTFNGNSYDMVMLSAAATGRFDNGMLKKLNDFIFNQENKFMRSWQIASEWGFEMLGLDHIDLIEIAPGDGSLKQYGGRLHCAKMQDLPYDPSQPLSYAQMMEVDRYCGNDLEVTQALYGALLEDIETRIELTSQYGVDMRSKSDAQIAEAAMKKLLGLTYKDAKKLNAQAQKPEGFAWNYQPVGFLKFQTPEMQAVYQRVLATKFTLTEKGGIEALSLKGYQFGFGGAVYTLGVGGLHSTESCISHRAGPDCVLTDFDVASYYPMIIKLLGLFPAHIGPIFLKHYCEWIETRLAHKAAKRKRKANTYKIKLNGAFGKTKEKHSILFDPVMFIQITLTGQLALLMMIERQYLTGVNAVQANTDGVVLKCHPSQVVARNTVVAQWEVDTGFMMEGTDYIALMSRDVNSYMAFKPAYTDDKGVYHPIEVKTKGEYADDPLSRLSKNPANQICLDAMKAHIIHGVPVEQTIRQCSDIRKFVTVRAVSGGGSWVQSDVIANRVSEMKELLARNGWVEVSRGLWNDPMAPGMSRKTAEAAKYLRDQAPRQFIGKTVRWYYGAGQVGHICTPAGGLVSKSQGAKPCMDLPPVLPPDLDYPWYVKETNSMLADLGLA